MSCSYCFEWTSGELEQEGKDGHVLAEVVGDEGDNSKHNSRRMKKVMRHFKNKDSF